MPVRIKVRINAAVRGLRKQYIEVTEGSKFVILSYQYREGLSSGSQGRNLGSSERRGGGGGLAQTYVLFGGWGDFFHLFLSYFVWNLGTFLKISSTGARCPVPGEARVVS